MGHELRRNFSLKDCLERPAGFLIKLAGRYDPTDEILDQCFGDRYVDVVMRHMVADSVGHPAQRQLAQIPCAQNQSLVQIGQTEQVRGALASLDVFERNVINFLSAGEGVVNIAEHLQAGRANIELSASYPESSHE